MTRCARAFLSHTPLAPPISRTYALPHTSDLGLSKPEKCRSEREAFRVRTRRHILVVAQTSVAQSQSSTRVLRSASSSSDPELREPRTSSRSPRTRVVWWPCFNLSWRGVCRVRGFYRFHDIPDSSATRGQFSFFLSFLFFFFFLAVTNWRSPV